MKINTTIFTKILVCFIIISSVLLTSCGGGETSTESGGASENASKSETDNESGENMDVSDDVSEKEQDDTETKLYLNTYEIRETENGKDALLFTEEAYERLSQIDSESFTYEMLLEIVDETVSLYQNNDTITFKPKAGSAIVDMEKNDSSGNVLITTPGEDEMHYAMATLAVFLFRQNAYDRRICDGEKIVFKCGKKVEEMDRVDKMLFYEILWLRLYNSIGSGCYSYSPHTGIQGGITTVYLTNDADSDYLLKKKLVGRPADHLYFLEDGNDDSVNEKSLLPEWYSLYDD